MLISTIISSINSAGTVIIIIIISVIITVIINSIGIVTKKTIRILIVVDFPVMSAPSAEFKDRTRLFLKQETFKQRQNSRLCCVDRQQSEYNIRFCQGTLDFTLCLNSRTTKLY